MLVPKLHRGNSIISHRECSTTRSPILDCNGTVKDCLTYPERPPSPEIIRRFNKWNNTKLEDHRIFHGIVYDPVLEVARNMRHGKLSDQPDSIKRIMNPKELTPMKHLLLNEEEAIYSSSKEKPLGKSHKPNLPDFIDPYKTTLGKPYDRYDSIRTIINPDKRRIEVLQDEVNDRKFYLKPYGRLLPGEQSHRSYTDSFEATKRFGIPTYCDSTGLHVRKAMDWTSTNTQKMPITSERWRDYFERHHVQDGKPLDPIKDTMNVPDDYTFGTRKLTHFGGVGPLMKGIVVRNLLGLTAPYKSTENFNGKQDVKKCTSLHERINQLRPILQHHLRQNNFKRGPEVTAVFCQLANGEELISEQLAQAVYEEFAPPLDEELREMLFDVARGNQSASVEDKTVKPAMSLDEVEPKIINWKLLSSLLDWNRMPQFDRNGHEKCMEQDPCIPDVVECADAVRIRLSKSIKSRLNDYQTTNQIYKGNRNGIFDKRLWRSLGTPSYKTHNVVPNPKSVIEFKNYADTGGAKSLLNPALMSWFNIGQRDMLMLRTKQDIREILAGSGLDKEVNGDCTFDDLWANAKLRDKSLLAELAPPDDDDRITMDSFRAALQDCNWKRITGEVNKKYESCCYSSL